MNKSLVWLVLWGVLFGYMEAAVVVYLREIYYPQGFAFPLVGIEEHVMLTELLREAATLFIMWATVSLAYQKVQSRFAAFFLLFGIWDIFYYIFLKLLLNWPESLETWDILFLIPLPWAGPVWAPMLVSIGFILTALIVLQENHQNRFIPFDWKFILLEISAAVIIIISFIIPAHAVIEQSVPTYFPHYLFLFGFLLGLGAFFYYVFRFRRDEKS